MENALETQHKQFLKLHGQLREFRIFINPENLSNTNANEKPKVRGSLIIDIYIKKMNRMRDVLQGFHHVRTIDRRNLVSGLIQKDLGQ